MKLCSFEQPLCVTLPYLGSNPLNSKTMVPRGTDPKLSSHNGRDSPVGDMSITS